MTELSYTLLSEGSSDRAFLPILTWLLRENGVKCAIQPQWANPHNFAPPPRSLEDRIRLSTLFWPCDLLFIHRDADRSSRAARIREISKALGVVIATQPMPPTICVVPVRMLETWLLFDEPALRRASGNPHGQEPLLLPRIRDLERLPNPKRVLRDLLLQASERTGRRRDKFSVSPYRVAELINDFSPLRTLPAFQTLEADVARLVMEQGWDSDE